MILENISDVYNTVLSFIAEITVHTLELVGILIIVVGSFRAIADTIIGLKNKKPTNVMVKLGRSLALALEFKMGAEIVNTVIVRDLEELGILAVVIALRAILAVLIHWEIKSERRDEELKALRDANKGEGGRTDEGEGTIADGETTPEGEAE